MTASVATSFADSQTRAAYVAIRQGLHDGSISLAQARKLVVGIHAPVFDSSVSDGDKQVQDYEKRQIYAALSATESRQPCSAGRNTAELFDVCLAELDLR